MDNLWTIETLKSLLVELRDSGQIRDWVVHVEHLHRRERYFLSEASHAFSIDQDRETNQQGIALRLLVDLKEKVGKQGEVYKKLTLNQSLSAQVERAIASAMQTESDFWTLPSQLPTDVPEVESFDPQIAEDIEGALRLLTLEIEKCATRTRSAKFSSSELFLSVIDRETHFSFGRVHRHRQTRVYLEAAFSASAQQQNGELLSDEFLGTRWSVALDPSSVEQLFDEVAENATHMLQVETPVAGEYSVIVDSEVLLRVLNEHLSQLSGANIYHHLPHVSPGQELIPGAEGDLLTLTIDPTVRMGADTTALSDDGFIQKPITLVEANRVVASLVGGQYSQYLGVPATTTRGTVVVSPGSLSYEEMRQSAPKVLEVLQFSGLFADGNSGTFSSEIRLARLHDRESAKSVYLKGGALSASVLENFKGLRLSQELVHRQHFESGQPGGEGYLGPRYALLTGVSVAV